MQVNQTIYSPLTPLFLTHTCKQTNTQRCCGSLYPYIILSIKYFSTYLRTCKLWCTATYWCVLEVDSNFEKQDCNHLYTVFYPAMVLQSVPMCITFIQSCVVLYKVVNQPPILAGAWSLLRISLSYPVMMLALRSLFTCGMFRTDVFGATFSVFCCLCSNTHRMC